VQSKDQSATDAFPRESAGLPDFAKDQFRSEDLPEGTNP
jgi:hypothetical protein